MMSKHLYQTLIFVFANLLLSSFYLDTWRNPNTTSRVLQVRSLFEDGTLFIDKYHEKTIDKSLVNGHYYADKGPLPAFLVWPMYSVLTKVGLLNEPELDDGDSIFLLAAFLTGSLPFVLIMLILYRRLKRSGMSQLHSILLSTLPFYGSMFFVYAGTFYSHILVAYFLLAALHNIFSNKRFFLAGLLCGAAFLSEYLVAVVVAIWFFQVLVTHGVKSAFLLGLGILPFIFFFGWYNYEITGNAFQTAYTYQVNYDMTNAGFTYPSFKAMLYMIFSPWRGLVFYWPIILGLIPVLWSTAKTPIKKILLHPAILPSVVFFIVVSAYKEWHGGWTFGPRYLIPILGLLAYAFFNKLKTVGIQSLWTWVPISMGIILAFLAKITAQYSIPSTHHFPFTEVLIPKLLSGSLNDTALLTRWFNISPFASYIVFLTLFSICLIWLILSKFWQKPVR